MYIMMVGTRLCSSLSIDAELDLWLLHQCLPDVLMLAHLLILFIWELFQKRF